MPYPENGNVYFQMSPLASARLGLSSEWDRKPRLATVEGREKGAGCSRGVRTPPDAAGAREFSEASGVTGLRSGHPIFTIAGDFA